MRESFTRPVEGPVLSRKFCCRLDDGWYLVRRNINSYHCTPIDGWRVWWWQFLVHIEATWRGFGYIRIT